VPIVESLMEKLTQQYGPEKGKRVYYAMEAEGKGPFAPGAKHRDKHEAFVERHNLPGGVGKPVKARVAPKRGRAPARAKPAVGKTRGRGR
jgi:hypothetical protein